MRQTYSRRLSVVSAFAVLATMTIFPGTPAANGQETLRQCERPDDSELWKSAGPARRNALGEASPPVFAEWFLGDGEIALSRIREALADYGTAIFSVTPNHMERELVIIVDASRTDQKAAIERTLADIEITVPTRVAVSCHSRSDLTEVQAALASPDFARSFEADFAQMIDPLQGRVLVVVDTRHGANLDDARKSLTEDFGDLVDVVDGTVDRLAGGRNQDLSPHYGAAGIKKSYSTEVRDCTANATIVGIFSARFMPTAGHCVTPAGSDWASGNQNYGDEALLAATYPEYDIALLTPPTGQSFTNRIWITTSQYRTVVGQRHANVNEYICMTGAESQPACNYWVVADDNSGSFTDPVGTTSHLDTVWFPISQNGCTHGDSGAPFYDAPASGQARVLGLLVGGGDIPAYGINFCWYHDSNVVSQYGSYATTP